MVEIKNSNSFIGNRIEKKRIENSSIYNLKNEGAESMLIPIYVVCSV